MMRQQSYPISNLFTFCLTYQSRAVHGDGDGPKVKKMQYRFRKNIFEVFIFILGHVYYQNVSRLFSGF